jgi:DNA-binding NarL/FixJ family response regulator
MKSPPITIAIVEDNPGLCHSLQQMLQRDAGLKCVGSFPTGEMAVLVLPGLQPQVVLMDINLPGMNGIECVARLAEQLPNTQIIMLTVHDDSNAIFDSLAAGASGYLLKPVRSAQLLNAIREIREGGAPMSSIIARRVIQAFKKPSAEGTQEVDQLAPREREILELLSQGLLQKEIAEQLAISYWTVQTHIGRLYEKLHVHSRAEAVAKYLRQPR